MNEAQEIAKEAILAGVEVTQKMEQAETGTVEIHEPEVIEDVYEEDLLDEEVRLARLDKPQRMGKMGVTDDEFERLMIKCGGYRSQMAQELGVTCKAIRKRIDSRPRLKAVDETLKQKVNDLAENELIKAIRRGEPWAICFQLKCKGGYFEKHEFTVADGEDHPPLTFVLPTRAQIADAKRVKEEIENADLPIPAVTDESGNQQ